MNLSAIDLVFVGENSTVYKVNNSKGNRAKVGAKTAMSKSQDKKNSKNSVNSLLAKSQVFAQGSK